MIRFEVLCDGAWVEAAYAAMIQYNRLSFRLPDGRRGIARIGEWRLSQATLDNPDFQQACWNGLTPEEKGAALLRKSLHATEGVHRRSLFVA